MKNIRKMLWTGVLINFANVIFAAEQVDFYATVSSSSDSNMIKVTTDLFYTQFQAIEGYTVNDLRDTEYSEELIESSPAEIAFYAEIQEDDGTSGWVCTLNAINAQTKANVSSVKKYANYYKILMDSKQSLENLLENLKNISVDSSEDKAVPSKSVKNFDLTERMENQSKLDLIAGTWDGGQYIEKIMILRGGRGFIIFKNGSSMSITVEIESNTAFIRQSGKSNASFYPELPRNIALQIAPSAPAIEWILEIKGNSMKGSKKTLILDSSSSTGVSESSVDVEWIRR